jgi:dUTP pyrophosphatase
MLKVKLLHPDAKAPTVSYAGSDLGFDLYALEDVVLQPGVISRVRTGIAVEGPAGYGFVLGDRSSMAVKGVTYLGGRIDAGYRGEILVCLMNVNQTEVSLQVMRNDAGAVTDVRLQQSDVSVTSARATASSRCRSFGRIRTAPSRLSTNSARALARPRVSAPADVDSAIPPLLCKKPEW